MMKTKSARRGAFWGPMCVALALAALPGRAAAEECEGTQLELNDCAGKALNEADAALNKRYDEIIARLKRDPETTKLLREAERAWIAFRDAECAFAASGVEGGSIYPMIAAECRQTLTEERTRALDAYLDCQEGDLSCPVPPPQ